MSRFETISADLSLEDLAKHNRNFDRADADLASLQTQISAEQQARIAAVNEHIQAIAAHAASAITLSAVAGMSASTVQAAIAELRNILTTIIAGPAPSAAEIQAARVGADNVARASLDILIKEIHAKQLAAQEQKATIKRGANVINTSQASGATFKVLGCTRCNILGKDGGCESLATFATSGSGTDALSSFEGIKSIKFTSSPDAKVRYKDYAYALDQSKYYLVGCWVYVESYTSGTASLALRDIATNTPRYTAAINTSLVGQKQFIYTKVPLSNTLGNGFRLYFGIISSGTMSVQFGAIRLYEVSAADYAAIGTTITGDAIDAYLPYVDSVQHLQGMSVRKTGKNLLPPFSQWTLHANAVATEPYKLALNATAANQWTSYEIPVVAGQSYGYSVVGDNANVKIAIDQLRSDNTIQGSTVFATAASPTISITPIANTAKLRVYIGSATAGTFNISNPQLEIGNAVSPFEPRIDQYAHVPVKLASNVDRSIADSYDSATGQVFRRWRSGVKLDGSLAWIGADDRNGYKWVRVAQSAFSNKSISIVSVVTRHDGAVLRTLPTTSSTTEFNATDGFANCVFEWAGGNFLLSILDTDSGWTETLNPNANAIKALMNGWKANGNNGSVYNSWVSILDGSAPATNTEAYVAANKAPGWDAWATLDYVLATPVVEQLTGDIGGLSLDAGGNALELLEGVIVREKANPGFASGASPTRYYINELGLIGSAPDSPLKYRTNVILAVYRNSVRDYTWKVTNPSTNGNGTAVAECLTTDYDPDAEYFVDYIVLDRYAYTANAVDATISYESNQGSVIAQNVQDIAAIKTHDDVQDWILAQHTARLLALEEA